MATRTSSYRVSLDHFEPQETTDPQAQRRLRGQLEQIDYTAFAANKEALSRRWGRPTPPASNIWPWRPPRPAPTGSRRRCG